MCTLLHKKVLGGFFMDYSYGYSTSSSDAALFAGLGIVYFIVCLLLSAFMIVVMWKIFAKANQPGWAAIVPFYNSYVLFDITWGNGILFLLLLIPFVNFVIMLITIAKLAQSFGKGGGFLVGLIFLPVIFLPMLAFGSAQYIGPGGVPAQPVYQQQPMYQQPGYQQPPYQPNYQQQPPVNQPPYQQPPTNNNQQF
jgi:hypothetical protein